MKNLLKITLFVLFTFGAVSTMSAQEKYGNALNGFVKFGDPTSISGYFEIDLAPNLTISPEATLPFDFKSGIIGARMDYYFDSLIRLNEPWDLWAGVGAGLKVGSTVSNNVDFSINAGVEYKFNKNLGVILDYGNGGVGLGLGIHM